MARPFPCPLRRPLPPAARTPRPASPARPSAPPRNIDLSQAGARAAAAIPPLRPLQRRAGRPVPLTTSSLVAAPPAGRASRRAQAPAAAPRKWNRAHAVCAPETRPGSARAACAPAPAGRPARSPPRSSRARRSRRGALMMQDRAGHRAIATADIAGRFVEQQFGHARESSICSLYVLIGNFLHCKMACPENGSSRGTDRWIRRPGPARTADLPARPIHLKRAELGGAWVIVRSVTRHSKPTRSRDRALRLWQQARNCLSIAVGERDQDFAAELIDEAARLACRAHQLAAPFGLPRGFPAGRDS